MKRIFITLSLVLSTIPMFAYYDFYDPNKTYYLKTGLTTTEGWVTFWFFITLFILILIGIFCIILINKVKNINDNIEMNNSEYNGCINKRKFLNYYINNNFDDAYNYLNTIFINAIYTIKIKVLIKNAIYNNESNFDIIMKENIEYFEEYYKMINKEIPDNIKNIKFEDIKNI